MTSPFILVIALLTIESSYSGNVERPRNGVPDTVQFWFSPDSDWRTKTFAVDHDIHTHQLRESSQERKYDPDQAIANTRKNYGDVIDRVLVLQFENPKDAAEVARVLAANHLSGTIEFGKSGVVFYNPDAGHYHTQSKPE